MNLLFYAVTLFVLVSGVLRGIKAAKSRGASFYFGVTTALFSTVGLASWLIGIVFGLYSIATFDERHNTPAIIAQIAILSGSLMFYSFVLSLIGHILLFFRHRNTEQGAAANP